MHPLELKLKQGAKPVCLRPYPATKTQEVVLKNMMTTLKKIGVFGKYKNPEQRSLLFNKPNLKVSG